jgi:xylulokinase
MNPYWDDDASGAIVGLRGHHGPAHLYRAILEGIAFEQRLHTGRVEQAIDGPVRELVVLGGGAQSALWCGIVADVLGKPLVRAESTEATSLGAAMLAAVGAGVHPDAAAASRAMSRLGARFEPSDARERYDALYEKAYARLYPALRDPTARLSELTS